MSPEVAVKNLRKDADYFGLDSLVQAIDLHLNPPAIPVPFPSSLAKEHETTSILDFDRFVEPGADLKLDAEHNDWKVRVEGMEGTHFYRRRNVIVRLTLQENETEGPGSILSNGEDRMELIVIIKVHGRDPPMASNGRSASSISLSTMPMYLTELDSITINGSATTSTELVSVLAGSCDDVTSPKWIRDLVKCRRDHALGFHEDDNETWHSMVRGSVVPSIELIADELIVFIDVAERSPSVTNLLNCRYAYASLRTMDKRASEWEQAIKAVDSRS